MSYRKIPNENFDFVAEDLNYDTIESNIIRRFDLGYVDSSNFMELLEGQNPRLCIVATAGIIEFNAIVNKQIDGSYRVICWPTSIKKEI